MGGVSEARVPQELWANDGEPPRIQDVLSRVGGLLKELGYEKSWAALEKESKKRGVSLEGSESGDGKELLNLWAKTAVPEPSGDGSNSEAEGGASVDESDSSEDSSSDSDSSEDSSSDSSVRAGQKRKRASSSSDSSSSESSDSDSSSSSSDDSSEDERPAKKARLSKKGKSSSSSSSDSSSDSSSSDSRSAKAKGKKKSASSASSASSSSSSSDSSSSDSSTESEAEENSSSSGRKPSSPSPAPRAKKPKPVKKDSVASLPVPAVAAKKPSSISSSATLDGENGTENENETSNDNDPDASNSSMHPDRANRMAPQPTTKKEQAAIVKKENIPFSRIPKNQQVDPRFGSNQYVSYDYADRAYKDLSVTKGKGFTKEKNKKKRGTSVYKSAEQRDYERQARRDLSLSSGSERGLSVDDLPYFLDDKPLGFEGETFDFMAGCGFHPISGRFAF